MGVAAAKVKVRPWPGFEGFQFSGVFTALSRISVFNS
jgi:hypothetical protein